MSLAFFYFYRFFLELFHCRFPISTKYLITLLLIYLFMLMTHIEWFDLLFIKYVHEFSRYLASAKMIQLCASKQTEFWLQNKPSTETKRTKEKISKIERKKKTLFEFTHHSGHVLHRFAKFETVVAYFRIIILAVFCCCSIPDSLFENSL